MSCIKTFKLYFVSWIEINKILKLFKAILTKKHFNINVFKNGLVSFLSFLLSLKFWKLDFKLRKNKNFIPLMHAPVLTSHLVPGGQCSQPSTTTTSCSVRVS